MSWTRREFLKTGAAAGGALALGCAGPGNPVATGELILRTIPSSGISVPIIGLGTRNYRAGADDLESLSGFRETLSRFAELGGRILDTAPSYGNSEEVLGQLIEELGIREQVFIATKVDRQDQEEVEARFAESRSSLRSDFVDLVQVHNLRGAASNLALLTEWKQEGRIGHIGITTSSDRQYEEYEAILTQNVLDFIQIDYSLDNRSAADRILPIAADRGTAVLVNMPFGRGRLFRRVGDRPLPEWASEFGATTWAQFFLSYVVSNPNVTAAIPGTENLVFLDDNFSVARGVLPDAPMRARMEAFLDALPES